MMSAFLHDDFLLDTELAQRLYHVYAENLPIIDYHTHLAARDLAENRRDPNPAAVFCDTPFSQRTMRAAGVPEEIIAGRIGTPRERFDHFAAVLVQAAGSPLYLWTHLVLRRCFDCDLVLSPKTAGSVWAHCRERLAAPRFGMEEILQRGRVELVCTNDDAADELHYHKALRETHAGEEAGGLVVLPTLHLGASLAIGHPDWGNYIRYQIGQLADVDITTMRDLREALEKRFDAFAALGCRTADLPLSTICWREAAEYELDDIVGRLVNGRGAPDHEEIAKCQTAILKFAGEMCAARGWIMQIHMGVLRGQNRTMAARLGRDAGFDSISAATDGSGLAALLDNLTHRGALPRMVVSSMNPAAQVVIGSVLGAFQSGGAAGAGKLQQGLSWVAAQTRGGLFAQLTELASLGVLGRTIAPASEAISAFSWTRHEQYRRVLCTFLAHLVDLGVCPEDEEALGHIVQDVCYHNVQQYFLGKE